MLNLLINLTKANKKILMVVVDSVLVILVLLASFSLRLDYWYLPKSYEKDLIMIIFGSPIIAIPIFSYFGLYQSVIRHIEAQGLKDVMRASLIYSMVWGIVVFLAGVKGIPRSVMLINVMLSFIAIGGVRLFARKLLSNKVKGNKNRVLIYGAGDAGVQLVSALANSSQHIPLGFVDDDKALQGRHIRGLPIYSDDEIEGLIVALKLDEVLIAMPSASRKRRVTLVKKLESLPVLVRILPGVAELAQGKIKITDLRDVGINDLLGRDSIKASEDLLGKNIVNKVVLVTGAGGSIGTELCRQILHLKPKILILYELSEFALYSVEKELSLINIHSIIIYPILGNVNNKKRLKIIFERFHVNTIYHSAAYKHVPLVEFNNSEGVENNIFGTLNCAQVAIDMGVETFVLISTDKAVRPTNIMGASKRVAEMVLQALSTKDNHTRFTMVRFGNVLGSSGSVIPLFKEQIKAGGPVTVTNKEVIRYFMTTPEAVELVIQAGAMGKGGEVFVLDMGEPVRIKELAEKLIRLSGLNVKDEENPDGDIEIKYMGLRPGEKLYEELIIDSNVSETTNPYIVSAQENFLAWEVLEPLLDEINHALDKSDYELIRKLLIQIVPEYKPQHGISDLLYKS
jgi:FlaA1/EpsC-like NDP-sugar epimerase